MLAAIVTMAGCAVMPLHGSNGAAARWQNTIVVDAPDSVIGFRLAERLEATFGSQTAAQYRLTVVPQIEPVPATITVDGDSTRFNLTGNATWTLVDRAGEKIGEGLEQTFTSYSATGSTAATQAVESDAQARLAVALADLISQRLALLEVPR
ncbi:MAG: LPS assembly lipoprotein LptE [Yoonia sp.]|uniref:LPS assembly lipoprotein LptE n=1 Tax=Yoonia sp. TaxID=2212373 RepID=UPI00326437F3